MKKQSLPNLQKVEQVVNEIREKYSIHSKFTKADFKRICKAENITFVELELTGKGYYVISRKLNSYIYIKAGLSRACFLETAAHELGHHFLGHLNVLKTRGISTKRMEDGSFAIENQDLELEQELELEANYFAELLTKNGGKNQ